MQKFSQKYSLVHTIKDLPDGYEYSMEDWPLHVTLADVFAIEGNIEDLLVDLREKLSVEKPVQSTVIGEEWFGPDKSVHVMLLDRTKELQHLHQSILEVLKQYRVKFNNPEYTNEGFRPHSTVQKNEQLELGDSVTFDSITLIDLFPNNNPFKRMIIRTIHF